MFNHLLAFDLRPKQQQMALDTLVGSVNALLSMTLDLVVAKLHTNNIPHKLNLCMALTPIIEDEVVAIMGEVVSLDTPPLIPYPFAKFMAKLTTWPYSADITILIMPIKALSLIWQLIRHSFLHCQMLTGTLIPVWQIISPVNFATWRCNPTNLPLATIRFILVTRQVCLPKILILLLSQSLSTPFI